MNSQAEPQLILGHQLEKARELLQFSPEDVAQKLGVSPNGVIACEQQRATPTLRQLQGLAVLYGRDIDYFLIPTPAPPERIEFRGVPGRSLKDLPTDARLVLGRLDELCRLSLELETLLDQKREVRLPRFNTTEPPQSVARRLREQFRADNKPLLKLRELLEEQGLRIFELPVPEDAFSGISFWHPAYGACVLVNAKESPGRKNFTLAHELAHLLYQQGSSLCYIPQIFQRVQESIEQIANKTAVELLLPEDGVREDFRGRDLSGSPSDNELHNMARKWN